MASAISEFVDSYIAAYNARNVDALLNLYTEDATLEDPVGSPTKRGREELREFWENAVQFDMTLRRGDTIFVCGNEAAIGLRVGIGTPDGRKELDIINIMAFASDGRIKGARSFYDVSAIEETLRAG